jgi:hypothetical protein
MTTLRVARREARDAGTGNAESFLGCGKALAPERLGT